MNLCLFIAGGSLFFDGTPLVGQSIARVRTSSHTFMFSTLLVMDLSYREPRYFLCLSTTVLDLSASLKDLRLWNEVRSTSACTTNGSPFSGYRKTSHCLVGIPARYVRGSSSSPHCLYHDPLQVTIVGQSAGAMSISYFYLNDDFSTVARAAVRALSGTLTRCHNLYDAYHRS